MGARGSLKGRLRFEPLTPERWDDLERLFGERGACGGCWCMWWRMPRSAFEKSKGEGNRRALKRIVDAGEVPGLIAYDGDEPVGWCAVAPREAYPVLDRSRVLARVDDEPVWSVPCFFVSRQVRRQGVSVALLRAAAQHAQAHGARVLEGYPIEPKGASMPDAFAWVGLPGSFKKAGFKEVLRRSPHRPIMRKRIRTRSSRTAGGRQATV